MAGLLTSCGREPGPAFEEPDRQPSSGPVQVEGRILEVSHTASVMVIHDAENRMWSVSLAGRPAVLTDRPSGGSTADLLPGLPVAVYGRQRTADSIRPDSLRVLEMPGILLVRPREGVALTRPAIPIEGHTRYGRNAHYRLLHGDDVMLEGQLSSEAFGTRDYGAFRGELVLERHDLERPLTLEVWTEPAADEPLRRTVRFADERQLTLYFPSRAADPQRLRCENVYPVRVPAPVLLSPTAVVEMLLVEPQADARRQGFFSEVSMLGDLHAVRLAGSNAVVEFAGGGASAVMDSCGSRAARAQLEATLRAAFGVDSVHVVPGQIR